MIGTFGADQHVSGRLAVTSLQHLLQAQFPNHEAADLLEQAQLLLTNYFYENRGLGMPLEKSAEGQALDSLCRPFRKPTLK